MRLERWLIGAMLAAALGGTVLGQALPQPAPIPPLPATPNVLLPGTQAVLDGYVAQNRLPGIVAAFGVGDLLPTQFVAAGRLAATPSRPAEPDSLWRIYSMTKPVTAMAVMLLIEEGKLRLDEPVADILPAFRSMRVLTDPADGLASRPARTPITIRHLLTHTAGLGYTIVTRGPLLREYERLGLTPMAVDARTEAKARESRPKTLAEFANRVATLPLLAEPGTQWSYSIGFDVLGRVVEVASGMPFDRFLQTRLFDPLGMRSTYFTVPANEAWRLATTYAYLGPNAVPIDPGATSVFLALPSFPYGGAGLVSSARDYDRFLHMLQDGGSLDGVRILKPETVALALSNLLQPGVFYRGIDGNEPPMGFGAGGSVTLADRAGGPARGTYAWGGAAGTLAFVDPVRHARGTIMVNYFPPDRLPLRQEVFGAFAADAARLRR